MGCFRFRDDKRTCKACRDEQADDMLWREQVDYSVGGERTRIPPRIRTKRVRDPSIYNCEHGLSPSLCRQGCGGASICEHGIPKTICRQRTNKRHHHQGCGGGSICEHGIQKTVCRQGCGGGSNCEHGIPKSRCNKGCGGGSICKNGKKRSNCKEEGCGKHLFCEHGKYRSCATRVVSSILRPT